MKFRFLPSLKKRLSSFKKTKFLKTIQASEKRKIKPVVIYAVIILAVILPTIYVLNNRPRESAAAWFDDNWSYRKIVTVTVTSNASDVSNLETLITVDTDDLVTAGKLQSDCDDLRFTDTTGKLLPYYIDNGCNGNNTEIWVLIEKVPSGTTSYDISMYYGNSTVAAGSDGGALWRVRGLVGYWKMNETAANSCTGGANDSCDSSASGFDGAWSGNVASAASGQYDRGTSYDNTDDFIDITHNAALNSQTMTLSTWVNFSEVGVNNAILTKEPSGASGQIGYGFRQRSDNTLWFVIGREGSSPGLVISTTTISASTWYHLVGTYDGATVAFYINGELEGLDDDTSTVNSTATLRFGSLTTGGAEDFFGTMDETRFYNRALSAVEVSKLYSDPGSTATQSKANTVPSTAFASEETAPAPLGYWKFDEGSGATVYSSGNDNGSSGSLGTGGSEPQWQTADECISGSCIAFDGVDDWVNTGEDYSWAQTEPFSFSWWMNAKATQNATIFGKGLTGATTWEYSMRIANDTPAFIYWNTGGTGAIVVSGDPIEHDKWYHMTVTYDGSTALMYTNGQVVGTQTGVTGTFQNRANSLQIGRGYYNGGVAGYFPGSIDEVKVYNYTRSAEQVYSDFIKGATNKGANAVLGFEDQEYLSEGLVGYWKMAETAANSCTGGTNDTCDSSGNGNDGAWAGNVAATGGNYDYGTVFDGTGDSITLGTPAELNPTEEITVAGWFNLSSLVNEWAVAKWQSGACDATSSSYVLVPYYSTASAPTFFICDGTSSDAISSTTVPATGSWYHIVGTFKSGEIKIYVNGRLEGSDTTTITSLNAGATDVVTFGGPSGGANYSGSMDEIRIYNRALSPRDVSNLYEWTPSPAGEWKLDENTGSTAADSIGEFTSTLVSSPTWSPGKYGSALTFNGSTSYGDMGDVLDMGLSDWTTSLWFRTADSDGNLISKSLAGNLLGRWFTILQTGNITSALDPDGVGGTVTVSTSSAPYLDNKWHHVATTYDRQGLMSLYLDGVLVSSASISGHSAVNISTTCSLFIGRYNDSSNCNNPFASSLHLNGSVDNVKIYSYALSQKQVIRDMNAGHPAVGTPVASPVLDLKMDEGYGTTLNNLGVGGTWANGTLGVGSSAPSWTNNGKFGKGISFDGSNDYISVNDSVAFTMSEYTVSLWVNPTALPAAGKVYQLVNQWGGGGAGAASWTLDILETGLLRLSNHDASTTCTFSGTNAIPTGEWSSIQGVYTGGTSGTNAFLYINGVQDKAGTLSCTTQNSAYPVKIGLPHVAGGTTADYSGVMDDVKVYAYALSPEEIMLENNGGKSIALGSVSTTSAGVSDNSSARSYCVPGDSTSCSAPVGEWKLDENTGTSAFDNSANGFTGTLGLGSSAPTWVPGIVGSAAKFDGTNDVITLGDVGDTTSEVTLSAWIRPASIAGAAFRGILIKRDGGNSTTNWALRQSIASFAGADELEFYHFNGAFKIWNTTNANLVANEWAHIAVTYDGASDPIVYKNGVVLTGAWNVSFVGPAAMVANNFNATIGGTNSGGAEPFLGDIDLARIYNYVRTPAQIAWEYNRGRPVAYYKMDECEGVTIYNSAQTYNGSPAGGNGTLTIGATGTNTTAGTCSTSGAWFEGATGRYSSSVNFDGTNDRFTFTTGSLLAPAAGSVSMWINSDGSQANPAYAFSNPSTATNSRIYISWGGGTLVSARLGDATTIGSFDVVHGQWHHLVVTWDGTEGRFYVDGIDRTTTGTFNGLTTLTTPTIVGCQNSSGTQCFDGRIDDVKTFLYPLTPAQVKTEYTLGAASFE